MVHAARRVIAGVAVASLILLTASASAANGLVPVEAVAGVWESHPAATADHVAWATWSPGDDGDTVVARARAGGPTWRVSQRGSFGYGAATIPGTSSILYQQYGDGRSDLYTYDLSTKTRKPLPAKVNTSAWEYWGVASKQYVLFMRIVGKERQLLLFDRKAGTTKKLAEVPERCSSCLEPTWVGADAAVYESCSRTTYLCDVKVWREGKSTLIVPGRTSGYSQYGATMDEATQTLYLVRGTSWCGLFVELRRWTIGDPEPQTIYDFPEGIDAGHVAIGPSPIDGDVDAFLDVWECVPDESDIYSFPSVDEALPIAAPLERAPGLSGRRPVTGPEVG